MAATDGPKLMPERILEVEGLSVDIPVPSGMLHPVQDLSFHVDRGETLAIVGESGCGKSLTSLALMDLLPSRATRRAATLTLEGKDLTQLTERQMSDLRGNRMSMIFQEPMTSLNPAYTLGDQLIEAGCWRKSASQRRAGGWGSTPTSSPAGCASG
jgi:peptide/nickel transport system ATP-binding protein